MLLRNAAAVPLAGAAGAVGVLAAAMERAQSHSGEHERHRTGLLQIRIAAPDTMRQARVTRSVGRA